MPIDSKSAESSYIASENPEQTLTYKAKGWVDLIKDNIGIPSYIFITARAHLGPALWAQFFGLVLWALLGQGPLGPILGLALWALLDPSPLVLILGPGPFDPSWGVEWGGDPSAVTWPKPWPWPRPMLGWLARLAWLGWLGWLGWIGWIG